MSRGDLYNTAQEICGAAMDKLAGYPQPATRRQRLELQRQQVKAALDNLDRAIAALDQHPELEEFMETLARAGA
jgi:chaperonin cofactor prefoldin